ncbi:MAG: YegS/Rv2252/BmrU family lipid kinase [Eubacterium sp.]|nr:YegS/Rv2252/BmrU family lipid kinase [Eubacterium sp.]
MKYYFFINPAAGQGNKSEKLIAEIESTMRESGEEYEVFLTNTAYDGEHKARELAEKLNGEPGRFYACGGDGTAGEIVNGIIGFENVEFGIIPIGTGNDTVRNFPEAGDFLSIEAQVKGESKLIDVMSFTGVIDGKYQRRYCLNMFNIGFDCNVVETASKLKKNPLIVGAAVYHLAILHNFIEKSGVNLTIYDGDELVREGQMLLCAVTNGSYCGGGIKSSPQALVDDGYFDLNIVNNISRTKFLKLLPKYKAGTHLQSKGIEKVVYTRKCKQLKLLPHASKDFILCVDGEIVITEGIDVLICEKAIRFILPKN